jgi:hypothetical protein
MPKKMGGEISGQSLFIGKGAVVEANYLPSELPKFEGHPCILSLPRILTRKQAIAGMQRLLHYDRNPRDFPPQLRTHFVMDLLHFFQPLPIHLKLEGMISRMLRDGYLARNPVDVAYRGTLKERLQSFKDGHPLTSQFEPTASSFSALGMSGVGKSTGMRAVLSLYPQVIIHNHFQGRNFTAIQIVWLKLECPKDGSTTSICVEFFKVIDDLLGTNYTKLYASSARNTLELMLYMAIVAAEHHLGVLVIDEIQDLSTAKSGGAAQVLNFFVKLINTIDIPLILIGTYKAIPIMCSEFRLARRGSGQGDLVWDRMSFDEDWKLFAETLWDLQYVKKECKFTDELSEVLHDVSYGIPDIAIRSYIAAQIRAIETGIEVVTEDVLRSAYRDDFRLVNRILEVLKSGDITPPHGLEDVLPPAILPVHSIPSANEKAGESSELIPEKEGGKKVNRSSRKDGEPSVSSKDHKNGSGRDYLGIAPPRVVGRTMKRGDVCFEEDDLRGIVAEAMKLDSPRSAYQALLEAGYIRTASEFLE